VSSLEIIGRHRLYADFWITFARNGGKGNSRDRQAGVISLIEQMTCPYVFVDEMSTMSSDLLNTLFTVLKEYRSNPEDKLGIPSHLSLFNIVVLGDFSQNGPVVGNLFVFDNQRDRDRL
jgi:hypothetical protein